MDSTFAVGPPPKTIGQKMETILQKEEYDALILRDRKGWINNYSIADCDAMKRIQKVQKDFSPYSDEAKDARQAELDAGHCVLSLHRLYKCIHEDDSVPLTGLRHGQKENSEPIIPIEIYWDIINEILEEQPNKNMTMRQLKEAAAKKGFFNASLFDYVLPSTTERAMDEAITARPRPVRGPTMAMADVQRPAMADVQGPTMAMADVQALLATASSSGGATNLHFNFNQNPTIQHNPTITNVGTMNNNHGAGSQFERDTTEALRRIRGDTTTLRAMSQSRPTGRRPGFTTPDSSVRRNMDAEEFEMPVPPPFPSPQAAEDGGGKMSADPPEGKLPAVPEPESPQEMYSDEIPPRKAVNQDQVEAQQQPGPFQYQGNAANQDRSEAQPFGTGGLFGNAANQEAQAFGTGGLFNANAGNQGTQQQAQAFGTGGLFNANAGNQEVRPFRDRGGGLDLAKAANQDGGAIAPVVAGGFPVNRDHQDPGPANNAAINVPVAVGGFHFDPDALIIRATGTELRPLLSMERFAPPRNLVRAIRAHRGDGTLVAMFGNYIDDMGPDGKKLIQHLVLDALCLPEEAQAPPGSVQAAYNDSNGDIRTYFFDLEEVGLDWRPCKNADGTTIGRAFCLSFINNSSETFDAFARTFVRENGLSAMTNVMKMLSLLIPGHSDRWQVNDEGTTILRGDELWVPDAANVGINADKASASARGRLIAVWLVCEGLVRAAEWQESEDESGDEESDDESGEESDEEVSRPKEGETRFQFAQRRLQEFPDELKARAASLVDGTLERRDRDIARVIAALGITLNQATQAVTIRLFDTTFQYDPRRVWGTSNTPRVVGFLECSKQPLQVVHSNGNPLANAVALFEDEHATTWLCRSGMSSCVGDENYNRET
ncbi:MAG: hypothetical protein SGILL_007970, partial [Bacillariaceae sp.]